MRLQKYFASIENYEEKELKNNDEFAFLNANSSLFFNSSTIKILSG